MAIVSGDGPPDGGSAVRLVTKSEKVSLPDSGPSPESPLRGCPELTKIALVGELPILEEALKPVPWVWDGIATRSTIVYLAGPPGGGKTTLLFLILSGAISRSQRSLLGRNIEPMAEGKFFVLIEGEHGPGSASRKLVASCMTMKVDTSCLDRVVLIDRKSVLVGDSRWKEIKRMIEAGIVAHIAIDTIGRCAPSDSNSEQEQTRVFETIVQAIESAPAAEDQPNVWLLGHVKKGDGTKDVEDVSGSAARAGQADTIGLVIPNKEDGVIQSTTVYWPKVRDGDEPVYPVTFCVNAKSRTLEIVEKPKKDPLVDSDDLRELVDAFPERSGSWLAKKMGKRKEAVLATLESLRGAGLVRRVGDGWLVVEVNGSSDVPF